MKTNEQIYEDFYAGIRNIMNEDIDDSRRRKEIEDMMTFTERLLFRNKVLSLFKYSSYLKPEFVNEKEWASDDAILNSKVKFIGDISWDNDICDFIDRNWDRVDEIIDVLKEERQKIEIEVEKGKEKENESK